MTLMRFHVARASRISDADLEKNDEIANSEFHDKTLIFFKKLRNTEDVDWNT